jgi:hypothetical protein
MGTSRRRTPPAPVSPAPGTRRPRKLENPDKVSSPWAEIFRAVRDPMRPNFAVRGCAASGMQWGAAPDDNFQLPLLGEQLPRRQARLCARDNSRRSGQPSQSILTDVRTCSLLARKNAAGSSPLPADGLKVFLVHQLPLSPSTIGRERACADRRCKAASRRDAV